MTVARNVRPLGIRPRRTPKSYDSSRLGATLVPNADRAVSVPLGTRRAGVVPPFGLFLLDLPWYAWAGMVAALCVGALAGGLWGWHEAERAFWHGQAPVRQRLWSRAGKLRALFGALRVDREPRGADVWGELRDLEHDLLDLATPARQRKAARHE